jgi:hypothetical protein
MKLIIPVSYFFGEPRSELWSLNTDTGKKEKLHTLGDSDRAVSGKGITGLAKLDDDYLVACDFNRLIKIDRNTLKVVNSHEDEEFNDLHSLSVSHGRIYIANTGRDSIDVFNEQLEMLERIDSLVSDEWQKRSSGDYTVNGSYFDSTELGIPFYRRIGPDKWHLNHVFKTPKSLGGQTIATSFTARCLLDINTLQPVSSTFPTQPHDGFIYGDFLWITTVSGQIYKAPLSFPFEFKLVLDIFKVAPYQGWCRGLLIVEGVMFIGITSIFESSTRTNWLGCPIDETRSGIYQLKMDTMKIDTFHDFSSEDGSRIFTIIEDL